MCVCVCVCGWGGGCVCRAVHGSGRSSLCPTHSRLVGDRVGRCQTRNRSVLGSGFTGRFPVGWGQNLPERTKKVENWRDLSRSVQDPMPDLAEISLNSMLFPPNRAENHWIWCFSRRNLPNRAVKLVEKLEFAASCSLFGWVELNGF